MVFADLTMDIDVNYFTRFKNRDVFNIVFKYLSKKARTMHYWNGLSNTSGGVITGDLVNRFKVLNSLVSTVFTTWVTLISFEIRWLINWPNRNIIRRNLPSMFRKYYPNCCVIIDCSKLFIETPAACCSNCSGCYGDRATDVFIVRDSVKNYSLGIKLW